MCGRFVQAFDGARLRSLLGADPSGSAPAKHYNIAPGSEIKLLRPAEIDAAKALTWAPHPWGFQAKAKAPLLINARSETAAEKPTFAAAWRGQRALVPISGFYEWDRSTKPPQPHYLFSTASPILLVAALLLDQGTQAAACVLLTRAADPTVARIHHRMPLFIRFDSADAWLRGPADKADRCKAEAALEFHPVSPEVNKPAFDSPECLRPWTPPSDPQLALF